MMLRFLSHLPAPLLATLALAGCGDVSARGAADGAPAADTAAGLVLSLESSPIRSGDAVILEAALTNRTADSVTVRFDDTCQMLLYVTDPGGSILLPADGAWTCLDAPTSLVLPPEGSKRRSFVWTGHHDPYDRRSPRLPDGRYAAYTTLTGNVDGDRIRLRSESRTVRLGSGRP